MTEPQHSRIIPLVGTLTLLIVGILHVDRLPKAEPALRGEPCMVEPRSDWSDIEKWVWDRACHGQIADLNEHVRQTLDPRSREGWSDDRKLSATFLETVLLHDPYRGALTRRGVRIVGAWFDQPVDLNESDLPREIWLHRSRFTRDLDLSGARIGSWVSFEGSVFCETLNIFAATLASHVNLNGVKVRRLAAYLSNIAGDLSVTGKADIDEMILIDARIGGKLDLSGAKVSRTLNMDSVTIGSHLLMSGGAEFAEVGLASATIDGQLDLTGAKVNGKLEMSSATIGSHLFMSEAEFAEVGLGGAKIEADLNLIGSKVSGALNMDTATIGGDLFMREGAQFAQVVLTGATIDGQLDLTGAKVNGKLEMNSATIGSHLLMSGGAEFAEVGLAGAKIEGQLDLTGAKVNGKLEMNSATFGSHLLMSGGAEFAEVGLAGAKIEGDLSLIGSKLSGALNMDTATIGGDLFMRDGAQFAQVVLTGAKINGQLDLSGAKVNDKLDIGSADIGGSLLMRNDAKLSEIIILGSKIEGQLSLIGAEVTGPVNMQSVTVGSHVLIYDAYFEREIDLSFADIRGGLNLAAASLAGLDLTGTRIESELRLASGDRLPEWAADAKLTLHNTEVGALQDGAERKGVVGDQLSGPVENPPEPSRKSKDRRRGAWPKSLNLGWFYLPAPRRVGQGSEHRCPGHRRRNSRIEVVRGGVARQGRTIHATTLRAARQSAARYGPQPRGERRALRWPRAGTRTRLE